MVSSTSGSSAAAELARSLSALDAMLSASQNQVMDMADRLLKVQVQQAVQDESIGTRIDTSA
jgi:hypothetical protein